MRVPMSWLSEVVDVVPGSTGEDVAAALVRVGLEEEGLETGGVTGPLVVGRVLSAQDEPQKNGKTIRWCQVDVGEDEPRGIVCGAPNVVSGADVVVALPGAVLPGGFAIAARKTYGHVSDGMVASAREIGLGEEHDGIIVLAELVGPSRAAGLAPGQDAKELLGLEEVVVEVNVTPDRGYCFSVRGLGREYAHGARLDVSTAFRDPADVEVPAPHDGDAGGWPVTLAEHTGDEVGAGLAPGCARFATRVVRGIDAGAPAPFWLRRRLQQCGIRSISLAVDVTNYVMLLTGQPLHAYDAAALRGEIHVRRARRGERLTTLDDVERALSGEDLLITDDDGERPVGIAGVMGGAQTEVTDATTDVVVEAACFDAVTIARSARRHRLPSEASKRFERGVDPAIGPAAAQLAVDLLVAHGGGRVEPGAGDVRYATTAHAPEAITLRGGLVADVTGMDVPRGQAVELLEQVGCAVAPGDPLAGGESVTVTPPSWRPDLRADVDLVEEVARLHGYEHIPSVLPAAPVGAGLSFARLQRRRVAQALAVDGYVEVLTYPFTSGDRADQLMLAGADPRRRAMSIANPLSAQVPLLRTSVLATLVDAARRNLSRGGDSALGGSLALYEIGQVVLPPQDLPAAPVLGAERRPSDEELATLESAVPHQPVHVAGLLSGERLPDGVQGPGRAADHADAIAAAQLVAAVMGLTLAATATQHAPWHPGRCAELSVGGAVVGHAGELHPRVTLALDLTARTVAFELDLDALVTAAAEVDARARPVSTYPLAKEDLAVVVPEGVTADAVLAALRDGIDEAEVDGVRVGDVVEDLRVFDDYTGSPVPPDHRSLAFALRLRAPDRTLSAAETAAVRAAALAGVARVGGVLRG